MKTNQRKAVNVSIPKQLIIESRHYNINFSRVLEEKLLELLREKHEKTWLTENKEAIDDYNARIEKHGEFSKKLRKF